MSVFEIAYETEVRPLLKDAIDNALENEVKDVALKSIEFSAMHGIYMDYTPTYPIFQDSRRFTFMQDDNYETEVKDNELTINAVAKEGLQDLFYGSGQRSSGVDIGDIIAKGDKDFFQPFPRPWMDEGIEANLQKIEDALRSGLTRQGF
jgi:hypothetical protein